MMKWLLVEIYRMSPAWLCVFCAMAALGMCLLGRRFCRRSWWRKLLGSLLLLWTMAVLYATVVSRSGGSYGSFEIVPLHSYREVLETGKREILRSSFMNGLLFFPAGLLGAALLPRRKILWLVFCVAMFSLTIELIQFYLHLGNGEIDDILHNTLGALVGASGYELANAFPNILKRTYIVALNN